MRLIIKCNHSEGKIRLFDTYASHNVLKEERVNWMKYIIGSSKKEKRKNILCDFKKSLERKLLKLSHDLKNYCINLHHIIHVHFTLCLRS